MKLKRIMALVLCFAMVLSTMGFSVFADETTPVAKVGNTEYATIDEAIANWTNGTTLTLLADVTLTDVINLSSTEYHILDLGTYTMTAASKKDAIQIVNNGRSSASYALDIKADATNPGGITATGKAIVRTAGKSSVKDRPIIRFYNGVFNASYIVYHSGSNGTNCPQFQFHGGEFNGTIYTNRALNQFYGGTFTGSLQMSVDSSAYTLISGGTFKNLSNSMGSALNSDKFTIGSAKGVYDKEVYIDDNGNYVIAAAEPSQAIEAAVAKTPGTNDYLAYSKVATEGALNYTDVYVAIEKNNTSSSAITVYTDELDMTGINYKGTIVVPEGETLKVTNAPEGLKVKDTSGNELVANSNGVFGAVDEPETNADVIVEGVDVEIVPVDGVSDSYEVTLAEGATWTDGDSVTMTFPAVEGATDGDSAYVVHEHEGVSYIYVGKVADGSVTITNTVGFSTFTVYEGGLQEAIVAAVDGDTITLLTDITMTADAAYAINFSHKAVNIDGNGHKITQAADCEIGWALLYYQDSAPVTIKNLTFDGIKGGAAIWAINADINVENCVFQNGDHTQIQGFVRTTGSDATIKESKFLNNKCNMIITFNFDLDASEASVETLKVQNCEFIENTCADTAAIYFVKGASSEISDSTFIGNIVDTGSHGAVAYYSEGANGVVTGNVFENNTITAESARAGVLILEAGTTANENVFISNTISSTNSGATYVGTVVNKADADSEGIIVSGNYWGGGEPDVANVKGAETVLENYYISYENNQLGGLVLITQPPQDVTVENREQLQAALDNVTADITIRLVENVDYGIVYLRPSANNPATKEVDWIGNNYRYETYSLFEGLTIIGAEGATVDAIEIEGGTYHNTEHSQSETYPVMLSLIELKDVVIDGVTFTGKGGYDPQGYGNAINFSGNNIKVNGITLKNCILSDEQDNARLIYKTERTTYTHKYSYAGSEYTFIPSLANITVTGCTFNGGYMGLELRETENLVITNNTFNQVTSRDILIPVNTGCTYSGEVTITGNTSDGAGNRFIRADGIGNAVLTIKDNTIINYKGSDADFIKASGVTSQNATIENNTLNGKATVFEYDNGAYVVVAEGITALTGEGTETSPYLINNTDELKWFRDDVNSGNNYSGKYVKLTSDIDLNNEEWTPIAYNEKTFTGNFDGGYNTIKNLKITKELDNTSKNNGIGFFGRTDSPAVICNLTIENVDITGSLYVGSVVGHGYTGKKIENCTVKGNIAIDAWWYAGVIGGNGYMNLINNCHVIGNNGSYIKGNDGSYIGGIWGFRGEGNNQITNCTVTNLSITGVDRVGGICGIGHYGNTVEGCSIKDISIQATDPEATTVGLIVGACQGNSSEPTVFTGNTVENVTAKAGETEITGIYGTNINGSVAVTNYVAGVNGTLYETLAEAIAAANNGDTIVLLSDIELSGTVSVNKNITIDGDDNKITPADNFVSNGHNAAFVFEEGIETAAIKNITFSDFSGLIRVVRANFAEITIDNCDFNNNTVSEGVITSAYADLTVNACVFNNNTSDFAVINVGSDVDNGTKKVANITGNTFDGNSAGIAVVYAASSADVTGNSFNGNIHIGENANAGAILAGPYTGNMSYTININENAFVNAMSKGEVDLPAVFAEDWSSLGSTTAFDLSSNYWNGNAPAQSYATSGENPNVILEDYYTTYVDGELGGLVNNAEPVAKIGDVKYKTLQGAVNAAQDGDVIVLLADITLDTPIKLMQSITLNGGNHTLKYTGTDRAIDVPDTANGANVTVKNLKIVAKNANRGINYNTNGALKVENVTVTMGENVDSYAINFPTSSDNATVVIKDSELTSRIPVNVWGSNMDISIVDTLITSVDTSNIYDYSGIQLNRDDYGNIAEGTTVTVTGGSITALNDANEPSAAVSNWTATAEVTISDTTVVTGAVRNAVAMVAGVCFYDLQSAIDGVVENNYNAPITLIRDIELDKMVTVPKGANITLNLDGKKITGIDNATASFGLITNKGDLTITGNGTMTLVATNNRGWNAYSSVISNTVGGKLTIENGTFEHLGGTDMAYGIDNLTNGKGTYAETVINGGTIKSPYRAIRQFLNGVEAQNILTVNGGTVEGENKSIWMQDPSKNANTGTLTVGENASLIGDVYLFVTAGSTEWPVEVSIAAAALEGDFEVVTGNVPEGYELALEDGFYGVKEKVAVNPFKDAPLFLAALPDETVEGVTYHPVYMATSIDSLNYQKVGFYYIFSIFDPETNEVTFTAPYTTETSEVYSSISDANTTYTVESIGGNGAYLFMNKLMFNAEYYHNNNTQISITPYAYDMDGNKITGWTIVMTNEYFKSLQSGDVKQDMFKEEN